jgi:prepilin-type processing-associated H-X9-DG protein
VVTQIWPTLAGRHSNKMNIAFLDNGWVEAVFPPTAPPSYAVVPTVFEKDFDFCDHFRPSNSAQIKDSKIDARGLLKAITLSISPNPSNSTVKATITTPNILAISKLSISDAMGRQICFISGNSNALKKQIEKEI